MKILIFTLDITAQGGTERVSCLLGNILARKGHEASIFSLFGADYKPAYQIENDVSVFNFSKKRFNDCSKGEKIRHILETFLGFRKQIKASGFDVIIGQNFLCNVILWAAGFKKQTLACEHFKYDVYQKLTTRFRNLIYRSFRKVVVLTKSDAEKYLSEGFDNIAVIPNMLTFESSKKTSKDNSKRMISVGRLELQKGYDLLLPALVPVFAKHPEWEIYIFGDGDQRQSLEKLRDGLGLKENVFLRGFCEDIHREFLRASFSVVSSRFEGFPMVILESMSCEVPVVSFNCPQGPADLLESGAGILVEAENVEKMSEAINRMIEDDDFRSDCAAECLNSASRYSPEKIYKKWKEMLDEDNRSK